MSESQQPETPLARRLEQLDRRISETIEEVVQGLHRQVGQRLRHASEDMLRLIEGVKPEIPESFLNLIEELDFASRAPAPSTSLDRVLAAVARIDGETGQADILAALLASSEGFASRAAFFLVRDGQARCWGGRGFDDDPRGRTLDATAGPWPGLLAGEGALALDVDGSAEFTRALGADAGSQALVVPFSVRGRVAGALYADRRDDDEALDVQALQLLTYAATQALETSVVSPGASPALVFVPTVEEAGAEDVEAPEVEAPAVEAPEVEAPAVEAPEVEAPEVETPAVEAPEVEAPEVEAPAVEAPEVEAPEVEAPEVEAPEVEAPEVEAPDLDVEPEPTAEPEFETSKDIQYDADLSPDDIAQEAEPEPELEDTNIWELEEEDDEEPTQVGPAPSPEPSEAPTQQVPAVGQQTVRLDIAALQNQAAETAPPAAEPPSAPPAPEPAPPAPEPAPPAPEPAPPAPEPPPAAQAPSVDQEPSVDQDMSEDPTLMGRAAATPEAEPPPSPAGFAASPESFAQPQTEAPAPEAPAPPSFAAPTPAPPPTEPAAPADDEASGDASGGSTEVRPPTDLDGPGLAFATPPPTAVSGPASGDEEALHEEARRLARLLVSEIKLYNEEIIEEGRRKGNIYERLKDDIDRSRQMYEERIDPRLADQEDYFYQELVQRLAGGDESLLGM